MPPASPGCDASPKATSEQHRDIIADHVRFVGHHRCLPIEVARRAVCFGSSSLYLGERRIMIWSIRAGADD